ncbi:FluC/FEX family fluoride channel [Demequina soli]|uniref:FluC/FEX family fluoride channel n=1 Tax=Demequina soli TaxID=1638987 RepID=UPI0007834597|nr:CrcB family protein [Demequina soli]
MSRAAQLGLVLVGGAVGGALRMAVAAAFPETAGMVPWDLVLINAVGSFALGWAVARTQARGPWRLFPAVGPGLLGGFTTFSSMAVLRWSAEAPAVEAVAILLATVAIAVAAAGAGWWAGDRPPTPMDERAVFVEENE